ncbi:MAG: hypothetical protein AAF961_04490, partial [Planctomycetota bacterium]
MTYVVDLTLSLVRVLERAAFFRDKRLAGYAANASFWAHEIRHALDVIASSESRFAAYRIATGEASAETPVSAADLNSLKNRLTADATRFFR